MAHRSLFTNGVILSLSQAAPLNEGPSELHVILLGEDPGCQAPGLEKDLIPSWELWVFVVRKVMGKDTGHYNSDDGV